MPPDDETASDRGDRAAAPGRPVAPGRPAAPDRPTAPDRPDASRRPASPEDGATPARVGRPGRTSHPAQEPVVPSPHRRAPARFSWVGIALLGAAGVVAATVTFGVFLPAIGALGEAAARDPANLPDRITVCGRDWTKDALDRTFTRDEVVARTETDPIVVSTGLFPACPAEVGAPLIGNGDGMATVVYAQVGPDAFVSYGLAGGP